MNNIKIVHISDLHLSDEILQDPDDRLKFTHRYGHDPQSFLALDHYLNFNDWDILVITGDLSRIGEKKSFSIARNWINNKYTENGITVGLNLNEKKSKHCVIIPGNHDRFNGRFRQGSLTNYIKQFGEIKRDEKVKIKVKGKNINFHLFDSSWDEGSFGFGKIDKADLIPKVINDNEFDVAVLHHHFIQPPKHEREVQTELQNSAEVASYMLNSGFGAVMFGHTHRGYISSLSIEALSGLLNDKRKIGRLWKRFAPKTWLRKIDNDCLVSYKRESTQSGQLPTLESYFNFLYLRKNNFAIKAPSNFKTAKEFHNHVESFIEDASLTKEINRLKSKKMLVSLAPSACQDEAKWKGFNVIYLSSDNSVSFERYQYNGARFELKDESEHVA